MRALIAFSGQLQRVIDRQQDLPEEPGF
ncbi:protein of unknown function [Rhodovastum atsumiense]|nr:protein of unknown function [Rhodovastum atsumiense]